MLPMFPNFLFTHCKQQQKKGLMGPKELQKFVVTMD